MHIKRDLNMYIIHRNTYDLLSFLGDIGGLIDILRIFGSLLIGWVQTQNLKYFLIGSLYYKRIQPKQTLPTSRMKDMHDESHLQEIKAKIAKSMQSISKVETPYVL